MTWLFCTFAPWQWSSGSEQTRQWSLNFYSDLLGTSRDISWSFSLQDLYPQLTVSGLPLSAPFTIDEIATALFAMDMHASPGPDGFGPSFYKTF